MEGRQRAMREEVRQSRAALSLVQPSHQNIGRWQADAARLQAMAMRLRASGRTNPGVAAEAEALAQQVDAERDRLAGRIAGTDGEGAPHSRVTDTLKALDSISVGLGRAREILDGTSHA